MLSIIVCSRHQKLSNEFTENIKNTIGVDYEIIHVDNSENKYSIFSAYNFGYEQSTFPYLCFVHEDVLFHTQGWGEKIISHLQSPNTGIIGVAGGDIIPRVPASWATLISPGHNIIQSDRTGKNPTEHILKPLNYSQTKRSTIVLDGVLLCMRRNLMEKIHFDENLKGFHGYDYDISLQSFIAGYKNFVIYDIKLEHFSGGLTDILYFRNLILIFKKWEKYLPLIGENITLAEKNNIRKIEIEKLYQLIKKMVRKGFDVDEIKSTIVYYATLINYKPATLFLPFRITLIRLFNSPKYLIKKDRIKAQTRSKIG